MFTEYLYTVYSQMLQKTRKHLSLKSNKFPVVCQATAKDLLGLSQTQATLICFFCKKTTLPNKKHQNPTSQAVQINCKFYGPVFRWFLGRVIQLPRCSSAPPAVRSWAALRDRWATVGRCWTSHQRAQSQGFFCFNKFGVVVFLLEQLNSIWDDHSDILTVVVFVAVSDLWMFLCRFCLTCLRSLAGGHKTNPDMIQYVKDVYSTERLRCARVREHQTISTQDTWNILSIHCTKALHWRFNRPRRSCFGGASRQAGLCHVSKGSRRWKLEHAQHVQHFSILFEDNQSNRCLARTMQFTCSKSVHIGKPSRLKTNPVRPISEPWGPSMCRVWWSTRTVWLHWMAPSGAVVVLGLSERDRQRFQNRSSQGATSYRLITVWVEYLQWFPSDLTSAAGFGGDWSEGVPCGESLVGRSAGATATGVEINEAAQHLSRSFWFGYVLYSRSLLCIHRAPGAQVKQCQMIWWDDNFWIEPWASHICFHCLLPTLFVGVVVVIWHASCHFVPGGVECIGAITVGLRPPLRPLPSLRPQWHSSGVGAAWCDRLQVGGAPPESIARCIRCLVLVFPRVWLQRLGDLQWMLLGVPCGQWRLDERLECTSDGCSRSCKKGSQDCAGQWHPGDLHHHRGAAVGHVGWGGRPPAGHRHPLRPQAGSGQLFQGICSSTTAAVEGRRLISACDIGCAAGRC